MFMKCRNRSKGGNKGGLKIVFISNSCFAIKGARASISPFFQPIGLQLFVTPVR
jgi:hypothetical protein